MPVYDENGQVMGFGEGVSADQFDPDAPMWTEFWTIDEVIECIAGPEIGEKLCTLFPTAYDGPGWMSLMENWKKIPAEIQDEIKAAYLKEFPPIDYNE